MAVEAALITPLIMLLVFGIIEFSLYMRDAATVSSAVRAGARVASAAALAGPGTCPVGAGAPPCTPAVAPALAQAAADAIQRAGLSMPIDSIQQVMVYKANDKGYPGLDGSTTMPSSCAAVTNCVTYTWSAATQKFQYAGGTWASSSVNACFPGTLTAPLDRVGVAITATHKMITGLFGLTKTLTDHAVMDFEPAAAAVCRAGTHQ